MFRWLGLIGFMASLGGFGCMAPREIAVEDEERPKRMLKWIAGRPDDDEDKDKESKSEDKSNGDKNGNAADAGEQTKPNKEEEKDEIVTDRPDFTEASSTVGRGRIQLEGGYTFASKASGAGFTYDHSYPELLLRVGLFAEWFELRVGQFWTNQIDTTTGNRVVTAGPEDLYVGVKLGLAEQKRFLPEAALILQTTVPTGSPAFTSGEMMPGVNLLVGWNVVKDRVDVGGSIGANRVINELGQQHAHVNTSATVGISLTSKLKTYAEWFALYPIGSIVPGSGAEHFVNGGFAYKVTRNLQLDIRAGKGLSANSDDSFAGAGFAVRH